MRLCENAHGERFAMKIFRKHIHARQRHWDAEGGVFRSALESVGEEIAIMTIDIAPHQRLRACTGSSTT